MPAIAAIILAAGKGTRMNAPKTKNKVAYEIGGQPMIRYTVDHLHDAGITSLVTVVGFAATSVKKALKDEVVYAPQRLRLGTGHAVKCGLKFVPKDVDTVITMYGDDSAFYPPALYQSLLESHHKSHADVTLLTIIVDNPAGLGRIIRDTRGCMEAIIEEKNATPQEKQIKEINTGLFCFKRSFLDRMLPKITKNSVSHEYYLTDIIELAVKHQAKLNILLWPDNSIWHGVNTPCDLSTAAEKIQNLQ